MTAAIATNGVLLKDMELCRALVDSGVGYIDISMKGRNRQEWCDMTGYDGSEAQQQAIRNLASLPIDFTCSMVITPENVQFFCESVLIAHDNGAKQFSFTFIIDNDDAGEKDLTYLQKHDPMKLVGDFIAQIDRLSAITDDWWVEYSFPMCVYTEKQLELLKGRLATPCQIHLKNAVTFNTKMELLPCDMYIQQKLGKFGRDFSSYKEFLSLTESTNYSKTMGMIRKLPSDECSACKHFEVCHGGCPVLWKNYSFAALKEFKAKKSKHQNCTSSGFRSRISNGKPIS